jgi:hypothetical protein
MAWKSSDVRRSDSVGFTGMTALPVDGRKTWKIRCSEKYLGRKKFYNTGPWKSHFSAKISCLISGANVIKVFSFVVDDEAK